MDLILTIQMVYLDVQEKKNLEWIDTFSMKDID